MCCCSHPLRSNILFKYLLWSYLLNSQTWKWSGDPLLGPYFDSLKCPYLSNVTIRSQMKIQYVGHGEEHEGAKVEILLRLTLNNSPPYEMMFKENVLGSNHIISRFLAIMGTLLTSLALHW